jgi:hypothetical protein
MNKPDPPRLTVGQAIVIGVILLIGLLVLPEPAALVVLVVALGGFGLLMRGLFRLLLRWFGPPDRDTGGTDSTDQ